MVYKVITTISAEFDMFDDELSRSSSGVAGKCCSLSSDDFSSRNGVYVEEVEEKGF